MISNAFLLAYRYLRFHPLRSLILTFGTSVTLFLPVFTYFGSSAIQQALLSRGQSSPILIGKKGNEFDLTMNSLYFRGHIKDPLEFQEQMTASEYGLAVPIYVNHTVSGSALVGTSISYFRARGLSIHTGRNYALLGEVVAGAQTATDFHLKVGDKVRSDMQNLYNISGGYPMILEVVGILDANDTSDDNAFFTDIKTTWALDGYLHGHNEVTREDAINTEAKEGENLEATAAIFMFPEITEDNRNSFHLHGNTGELPISSVLLLPQNDQQHNIALGDYELRNDVQAVRPKLVVETILEILLGIQRALEGYFLVVSLSTLSFFSLTLYLSRQLRATELQIMERMGASRSMIRWMFIAEVSIVLLFSFFFATLLSIASIIAIQKLL
jgi:putative ABC transport system permease protein